jgi:hypothetical protein
MSDYAIVAVERRPTAVVKIYAMMNELPQAERSSRARIDAVLPSLGAGEIGAGFTLWRPPVDGVMYLEPGVLISRAFAPSGAVTPSELPAGRAAHCVLRGGYEQLPGAWGRLLDWCKERALMRAGTNWQIYERPDDDEAKQETSLYALLD